MTFTLSAPAVTQKSIVFLTKVLEKLIANLILTKDFISLNTR